MGAWDALERLIDSDENDNAVLGTLTVDATANVVATDGHVSLVGVEDLIVASFGDRTLVVPKADAQRVREVVAELRGESCSNPSASPAVAGHVLRIDPPSTASAAPVTYEDRALERKATTSPSSRGSPTRSSGASDQFSMPSS